MESKGKRLQICSRRLGQVQKKDFWELAGGGERNVAPGMRAEWRRGNSFGEF